MSLSYSQGPNSFIDNYILLLAARFNAPLQATSLSDNDSLGTWEKVAMCVREVLASPKTEEERIEVAHVDLSIFSAEVCRLRALYFKWHLQETPYPAISSFDITRDSLKGTVQGIYAAVRANLPTTLDYTLTENGAENVNKDTGNVVRNKVGNNTNNSDGDDDDDSVMEVLEFATCSEEDNGRLAFAKARDEFLTKVQAMQAEFFAQHRRWVDVPSDIMTEPLLNNRDGSDVITRRSSIVVGCGCSTPSNSTMAGTEKNMCTTAVLPNVTGFSEVAQHTPFDKTESGDLLSSPIQALKALKRSVLISRPPRPSEMLDQDYEAQYRATMQSTPEENGVVNDVETDLESYKRMAKASGPCPPQRPSFLDDVPVESYARPAERQRRWNVVEYDCEDDESSDETD